MPDDHSSSKDGTRQKGRVLRFTVSGSLLLAAPLTGWCTGEDPEDIHINVPPEPEQEFAPNPGPAEHDLPPPDTVAPPEGSAGFRDGVPPVPNPGAPSEPPSGE